MRKKIVGLFIFAVVIQAHADAKQITSPPVPLKVPRYEGELQIVLGDDGRHAKLISSYSYIDQKGMHWDVPSGAMVDGASIPQVAWSIIGGPFEGKYRNASVIHDWYCDRRTRAWQAVDRMFYEAMLTSGVDVKTAKIMYLAVVWGGPRWDEQTIYNNLIAPIDKPPRKSTENRGVVNVLPDSSSNWVFPTPDKGERLRSMVDTIEKQDLTLDQIDNLAEYDPGNVSKGIPLPELRLPFPF